jgi:1,4-alpha-glucan branching enzyme
MKEYQWEYLYNAKPKLDLEKFTSDFGYKVLKRDPKGKAEEIEFRIYAGKNAPQIQITGEFSNWSTKKDDRFILKPKDKDGFLFLILTGKEISHKSPFLFLVNGKLLRDPASKFFDKEGNSVFWDFDDPSCERIKERDIYSPEKSMMILQTDLEGMIVHYKGKNGKLGKDIRQEEYYKFISESGIIKTIKNLGFNAIQFLPFNQSIDGSKWSFRYLIPFLHSINKNWGDPDDFIRMVNAFHKEGIAIISDFVVSHAPHQKYRLFHKNSDLMGVHSWDAILNKDLYLKNETFWGTMRYDYSNPIIRKFIIGAALEFIKTYGIDGFRIDNVDGIIRKGKNGEGEERRFGRKFLREFTENLYKYSPRCVIHLESHFFAERNDRFLVAPLNSHPNAIGATAYTSSRITYFFHADFMLKSADDITPWMIKNINDEQEWLKSASTIADFHNHDAAAGLMEARATGSYAYDAMILKNKNLHFHAAGKIKVMEAIISFALEGRTLDLLQTHLLQEGTFEHDSSIHWDLLDKNPESIEFKREVNELIKEEAFWPKHSGKRQIINIDEKSKTIVIKRSKYKDDRSGFLILINMSAFETHNFVIPVVKNKIHKVILGSDKGKEFAPQPTNNFEYFKYGITFEKVCGYEVVVLEF